MLRPRLLDRLRKRFARNVTVVVAPAGFGKSTLLAQAVAENDLSPEGRDVWLSCSADHVVASALMASLCDAFGIVAPPSFEGAVDAVVDACWHHSPTQVALLFDDVHEIAAGSPGAEVLARLLDALPGNAHVVLSGRQQPPLPLSRLEVQGHVLRVSEADLLFTADELAQFAALRNVSSSQLAATEGWPALAELAASAVPGIETAYLWEEVLAGIPPARCHDLALLAHVGPVDEALASVVLGHDADLESLTAELPLIATTSDGYRHIHALWQPHLSKAVSANDIAEARRRAGLELARLGDIAPAVRLLADARAWDDVARVAIDTVAAAHPAVASDVVAAWLGRLPPSMADSSLARLLGAVTMVQSDPEAARAGLEQAAEDFRREANQAGEIACVVHLAQLAWWSEQPDRLVGVASRLFEMEALGSVQARPLASVARAFMADVTADSAGALAHLDEVPEGSLNPSLQVMADWLRSASLNHLGRPQEALAAAEAGKVRAGPVLTPIMEGVELAARWFLGDVDAVLRELPPLVRSIQELGLRHNATLHAATCAMSFTSTGDHERAALYLALARQTASSDIPLVGVNLAIAEAAAQVTRGDEEGAAATLRASLAAGPPLGAGLGAFPQRRSLVLWYLLLPESRVYWDAEELGPSFTVARALARSLVALRTDGRLPAGSATPALPAPDVVRSVMPLPWATEVALGYIAAERDGGWDLLERLWPNAQGDVRHHADLVASPLNRAARTVLSRLPVPPRRRALLNLLGPVELWRDGELVDAPEWRRERVRSLLAHLLLHRPISRERLADDLWPNLDPDAQSRNLRVTLSHLLRVLEPDRAKRDASFLVRPHGNGLILQVGDWLDSDLLRFDDLSRRAAEADARGLPSAALDAMLRAIDLWRGDPAELAANDWALPEVEERRFRLETMATRASELLLAQGEHDEARRLSELALRSNPWLSRANDVVVAAHTAAGNPHAAHKAQERFRTALEDL